MKASLSRGGGAFLVEEICSCAQREPSSLLPDVWVKWVHLPQSFLSHSCICKWFRWRDSNKMQPGAFRGKEMSCHNPCRLFMNWDTWTDLCPTEGMLQSSHCFPGNSFLGFFYAGIYCIRNNRRFFSGTQSFTLCYLPINFIFSWS